VIETTVKLQGLEIELQVLMSSWRRIEKVLRRYYSSFHQRHRTAAPGFPMAILAVSLPPYVIVRTVYVLVL
jgi:hypothetical protein